jgi:hypothetical protein
MQSLARVTFAKFVVPGIEQLDRPRGIGNFISQIVGRAAIGVHIIEMLLQAFGEQPRNDSEIFVVMRGKPARISLGFLHGATGRRRVAGDFEFSRILHGSGPDTGEPGAA